MNVTPTKRRALGSLDLNITRSPRSPSSTKFAASRGLGGLGGSPLKKKRTTSSTPSPSRKGTTPTKRPLLSVLAEGKENEDVLLLPATKKLCSDAKVLREVDSGRAKVTVEDVDEDEPIPASQASARRSISPDASSLFDTPSVMNTSQLTNITEPDTEAPAALTTPANDDVPVVPLPPSQTVSAATTPASVLGTLTSLPPPRPRRVPTREEFRQKAEILKLRLSLATYKVKTDQTDVPLDKLQIRPMPGMARRRTPLPSMSAHTIERATPVQYWYRSSRKQPSSSYTPPLPERKKDRLAAEDSEEEEEEEDIIDIPDKGQREDAEEEEVLLPKLDATLTTPRKKRSEADEEKLTSSALRGGAAKGLLSLSQGSH